MMHSHDAGVFTWKCNSQKGLSKLAALALTVLRCKLYFSLRWHPIC